MGNDITEKEVYSIAYEFIDEHTHRDGYALIPSDLREFLADIFVAGWFYSKGEIQK